MRRFIAQGTNEGFNCSHCGKQVLALANGSYRNHCPYCLYSLHVDINPGDRASDCQGSLKPIAVEHSGKKGWVIIHRCERCGEIRRNKAALDDPNLPDDFELIIQLSQNQSIAG